MAAVVRVTTVLLEWAGYFFSLVCVISGCLIMLASFELYEIDGRAEPDTDWPWMFGGFGLMALGIGVFTAMRPMA